MSFYNGTITGVAAGEPGSWTVEFQAPAGPSTMVLTQPPPAAETSGQKTRRLNRARTEAAATADLDDLRDAGAAATTAMEI